MTKMSLSLASDTPFHISHYCSSDPWWTSNIVYLMNEAMFNLTVSLLTHWSFLTQWIRPTMGTIYYWHILCGLEYDWYNLAAWRHHQIEKLLTLLDFMQGNHQPTYFDIQKLSTLLALAVCGIYQSILVSPPKGPVRHFMFLFLHLNKLWNNQSSCQWTETHGLSCGVPITS